MKNDTLALLFRNIRYHAFGTCNICGHISFFFCRDRNNARDMMWCLYCRSSSRKRLVAKTLLELLGNNLRSIGQIARMVDEISILNLDSRDQFTQMLLDNYKLYYCSELMDGISVGTEIRERVYCQDVEDMTFPDDTFDYVITEEVFEHIRNHIKGFQEIYRVLK